MYLLFEHKSFIDRDIGFQIIQYLVKIWKSTLHERKPGSLPIIIPLILYHGKSRWTVELNFSDYFNCPDSLRRFIPDFQYLLWDASAYDEEKIQGEASVVDVPLDEGRVVLFGFNVVNRWQTPAALKLLFNALYYR